MCFNRFLPTAGLLFSLSIFTAEASLTPYTSAGNSLVYDNVTNISWTGDANLLSTMAAANPNLINTIISTVGSINDTPNDYDTPAWSGHHTLTPGGDFGPTLADPQGFGLVDWFGAQAFVSYLNSINYAGSKQWTLPTVSASSPTGYNHSGQLGELYYSELHRLDYPGTNYLDYGILADGGYKTSGAASPFTNAQTYMYWLGTEAEFDASYAWHFDASYGGQYNALKYVQFYVWAVTPGEVVAPLPGSAWLFGGGVLAMLGLKRRFR